MLPAVDRTELTTVTGQVIEIQGIAEDVQTQLSAAAAGGGFELAWFTEVGTDKPVGVNPAHVVTIAPRR